ncbi:MAG: hypothetical protein NT075_34960 [Chloroflexi bacterium]|nr:hypothetical protein [Chloroflexota bacterium]
MKNFTFSLRYLFITYLLITLLGPSTAFAEFSHSQGEASPQAEGDAAWDDRFGYVGAVGRITAIAEAPNGDVYVGGDFTKAGGLAINHIARWDGRSWHALGDGLNGLPYQIAFDGNDVYVVGEFTAAGALTANQIARWDGAAWSNVGDGSGAQDDYFGSPATGKINTLVIADGKLFIGGNFVRIDQVPANNVAEWDGNTWSALDRGMGKLDFEEKFTPEGEVKTLALDGATLYAGGDFVLAGEATANGVAAWDGASWSALAGGVTRLDGNSTPESGIVSALVVNNGLLYAGGWFTKAGGSAANYIASWDGNAWSALGVGVRPEPFFSEAPISALAISNGALYVGGRFVNAGNQAIALIARWDGATWSGVGGGISNDGYDYVSVLAAGANDTLYTGGNFRIIGNQRVDNIAQWNGADWRALGGGLMASEYGDSPAKPYAIVVDEAGRIYAGGEFAIAGGVKVNNLALWENERWHNIGGANARVRALALAGDDLYVAGEFTQIGGIGASHIARWNRTTGQWSNLGSGINGDVYALAYSDGILYAGGAFKAAGGVIAEDVASWDGAQWHAFGAKSRIFEVGDQGSEVGTYVNALAVAGDSVFIGGHFQTIENGTNTADLSSFVVVHNIVEWNSRTDTWSWLGDNLHRGATYNGYSGFSIDVNTLAFIGDKLYVGGKFNQAGDLAASNLARWDRTAERWVSLNASLGGVDELAVNALATFGPNLFVGGKFTSAGNTTANFVAQLDTQTDLWSALGDGLKWYNDRFTAVYSLAATSQGLYVGGDFDKAGGLAASGFAYWHATLKGGTNVTPANGGTLKNADGVQINFPAGAVAQDSLVTLTALPGPTQPLPEDQRALYTFRGTATTLTGQAVTQFAKPYTLQVPYTDAQLAAVGITDPAKLNVGFWKGDVWTPLLPCAGCSIDTTNKLITIVADHFTDFALVGQVGKPSEQPSGQQIFLPLVKR